jgi:hypothetical protein
MSFALTEAQVVEGRKDMTRRSGWLFAKVGDICWAVNKSQGLKPGEHPRKICQIEITEIRRERLNEITAEDVRREGFPEMTPADFVRFFCKAMGGTRDQLLTVIGFRRLEEVVEEKPKKRGRARVGRAGGAR